MLGQWRWNNKDLYKSSVCDGKKGQEICTKDVITLTLFCFLLSAATSFNLLMWLSKKDVRSTYWWFTIWDETEEKDNFKTSKILNLFSFTLVRNIRKFSNQGLWIFVLARKGKVINHAKLVLRLWPFPEFQLRKLKVRAIEFQLI